jgi:hypothetical protein
MGELPTQEEGGILRVTGVSCVYPPGHISANWMDCPAC